MSYPRKENIIGYNNLFTAEMIINSTPQMKIVPFYVSFCLGPFGSDFGPNRTHQNKITVYDNTFLKPICMLSEQTCAKLLACSSNILL